MDWMAYRHSQMRATDGYFCSGPVQLLAQKDTALQRSREERNRRLLSMASSGKDRSKSKEIPAPPDVICSSLPARRPVYHVKLTEIGGALESFPLGAHSAAT